MEMSVILKLLTSDSDDDFLIGVEFLKKENLKFLELQQLASDLNASKETPSHLIFYPENDTIGRIKIARGWANISGITTSTTTTRII